MLQCYLQLLLGSTLFCEAIEVHQAAVGYFFFQYEIQIYLQVKLVILLVMVNFPRLTVIINQNKL